MGSWSLADRLQKSVREGYAVALSRTTATISKTFAKKEQIANVRFKGHRK